MKRALRRIWGNGKRFLREGVVGWIAVSLAIGSVWLSHKLAVATNEPFQLANTIRWIGMVWQLIGLGYVIVGLNESRRYFSKPGFFRSFLKWLASARYLFLDRPPIEMSAHFNESSIMRAHVTVSRAPANTLEERVDRLEKIADELEVNIGKAFHRIDDVRDEISREIKAETENRARADEKVSKQIEEAVIGGINIEFAGACFLVFGIILSSIPSEVANWIKVTWP